MDFPLRIPFVEDLGFELVRMADGEAELRCSPQPRHLNSFLVVHGGVLMTLLDVSMAHAARSTLPADEAGRTGALTVEMKTTFMRPGEGTALRCLGRVLHRTATLAFCEASVFSGDTLAAHATGTFKFARAVAARERSVRPVQAAG